MVQFRYRTPIGMAVTAQDAKAALRELHAAGRLVPVSRDGLVSAVRVWLGDQGLLHVSGRWKVGSVDPARFVPGDIAALRGIVTQPLVRDAIGFGIDEPAGRVTTLLDLDRLLGEPDSAALLLELYTAVPYFVPHSATAALLATHPPNPQRLARLRLPTPRTLVVFGADLPIDTGCYRWPALPVRQLPAGNIARDMLIRGGLVTGVVLLADPDGRLRDDCLWLCAAGPDPDRPFPASLDHVRTVIRGWRSAAQLRGLVETAAAAVVGAVWTPAPPSPALPTSPLDGRWASLASDPRFRRLEREGAAVGAAVLDLDQTAVRAAMRTGPPPVGSPATGLGRFAWSQEPTPGGPSAEVVWVPPTPTTLPAPTQRVTLSHLPRSLDGPLGDLDIDPP
jgi:hypothetical protein